MFSCLGISRASYDVFSCFFCYFYLFPSKKDLVADVSNVRLIPGPDSKISRNVSFITNIHNATVVSEICNFLTPSECSRWTTCCNSAMLCCDRHSSTPTNTISGTKCPRTWDGWGCFDDTPAGTTASITCPSYLDQPDTSAQAKRACTENGTWFIHPATNLAWTNYTSCTPVQEPTTALYVGLGGHILSLILLIVSLGIFLGFRSHRVPMRGFIFCLCSALLAVEQGGFFNRQLRKQQRIRIHICFLTSLIFSSIVSITWDFAVYQERFRAITDMKLSVLGQNTAWCKFLYMLLRYTHSCTYFWMFCEGLYLNRILIDGFRLPKNLILYYIIGWGSSGIPIVVYSVIKSTKKQYDTRCWVNQSNLEWIIWSPNLICLIVNVFFLVNILRILRQKIQTQPIDSNYRKGMKSMFVLIPLLGLHWAVVAYYGPDEWYIILRTILGSTQGGVVALVFCICNSEVHQQVWRFVTQLCPKLSKNRYRRKSSTYSGTIQCSHTVVQPLNASGIQEIKPMMTDTVAL